MTDNNNNTVDPPNESSETHYKDLMIGCILAIGGNLMISVSLNLQKYTHIKNEQREQPIHYTRNPLWWFGLSLMVFGEVGNFSAYGFAPASLVAPLGTTTVVANMFLAAIFLKEKIKAEHLFGSALAIIGAFLLVTFSSKTETALTGSQIYENLSQVSFIVYICIEGLMLIVLFILLYRFKKKLVVVYLLIVSIIASFTVISAKAVSSMLQLTMAGKAQWYSPMLYVMAAVLGITAIIQVKYLNQAMKNFDSTVVVPTNFVFFTMSAIMAGIIFYKEFWGMTALQVFMFLFGCLMSFVGVYFVTTGRNSCSFSKGLVSDEDPESPGRCRLTANIFPSWLLASINVGPVQPRNSSLPQYSDSQNDRQPFLDDDDSDSSQETIFSSAVPGTTPAHIPKKDFGSS
ncbi:hypothetical protein CHS0354_034569 [Potamilus streckersoni]|uniref:NIPA-like protein 2 n=1 Tax=Potamilus streckersoni TaxID=2493646 RepID=A0AAE0RQP7_9BIVA|nr:hypothetical protein CHS0354_034569 [Potamilus streckersoni]